MLGQPGCGVVVPPQSWERWPAASSPASFPFDALDRLRAEHEVEFWRGALPPTPAELRELATDAAGILSMLSDSIDRELIDACPDLRAVANYAVGTDNIDVAYAARARASPSATLPASSPRRPPTSPSR